jgi:hypothetical protein
VKERGAILLFIVMLYVKSIFFCNVVCTIKNLSIYLSISLYLELLNLLKKASKIRLVVLKIYAYIGTDSLKRL